MLDLVETNEILIILSPCALSFTFIRHQLNTIEERTAEEARRVQAQNQLQLNKLQDKIREGQLAHEAAVAKAKEQQQRNEASLKTLQTMFKDMSKNDDDMNMADLQNALARARATIQARDKEISELGSMREKAQRAGKSRSRPDTSNYLHACRFGSDLQSGCRDI